MKVGNEQSNDCQDMVAIPRNNLEEEDIVRAIFGTERIRSSDVRITDKIILTTRNEDANFINGSVLHLLEVKAKNIIRPTVLFQKIQR